MPFRVVLNKLVNFISVNQLRWTVIKCSHLHYCHIQYHSGDCMFCIVPLYWHSFTKQSGVKWFAQTNFGRVEGFRDLGSKWRELFGLIHPATEHLKHLGDIFISAAMSDYTTRCEGQFYVKTAVSVNIHGQGLWLMWRHTARDVETACSETLLMIYGD